MVLKIYLPMYMSMHTAYLIVLDSVGLTVFVQVLLLFCIAITLSRMTTRPTCHTELTRGSH